MNALHLYERPDGVHATRQDEERLRALSCRLADVTTWEAGATGGMIWLVRPEPLGLVMLMRQEVITILSYLETSRAG